MLLKRRNTDSNCVNWVFQSLELYDGWAMNSSLNLVLRSSTIACSWHEIVIISLKFGKYRMLHSCAEKGDFTQAEIVLRTMNENNQVPGPRAYHALIFSYVKGGYARGALNAIRAEVSKGMLKVYFVFDVFVRGTSLNCCITFHLAGIRPLPQSYAAVVHAFLQEGDIDTAIAVYASNRRSGVSAESSWNSLCATLYNQGDNEKADQLVLQVCHLVCSPTPLYKNANGLNFILLQGERDKFKPNKRLYSAMINSLCRRGDLKMSVERLHDMRRAGFQADKNILSAIVTAHALGNQIKGKSHGIS